MQQSGAHKVESIDEFFARTGPKPIPPDDVRRHPRFYYRTCAQVTVYPIRKGDAPTQTFVRTQDLSRSGFSMILATQVFPGQRLEVVLDGRPPMYAVVAWCHRLPDKHYSVGCRFTDGN